MAGVVLLASAHLYVQAQGPGYSGFFQVLDHGFTILCVLLLFLLCSAAGRFLLVRSRVPFEDPLEILLFSFALGAGAVSTSILFFGVLFGVSSMSLSGVLLFYTVLGRRELQETPHLLADGFRRLRDRVHPASLSIFALVTLFMVAQALTPPYDWDELMYHIRIPAQYLQEQRIYLPEDNLHAAYIQLVHMLYLPLLAFGAPSGPALVSAFFALLLGLAVYNFCLHFTDRLTANLSGVLVWGNAMLLFIAATARVGITLCLFLFLAHYSLFRAFYEPSKRVWFFLGGILLGLAIAVKYLAFLYVLALSPWILMIAVLSSKGKIDTLRSLFLFGILTVATSLPWQVKNWFLFERPFYPIVTSDLVQPWLTSLYPGQDLVSGGESEVFTMLRSVREPFDLYKFFVSPGRLTVEAEGRFYFPSFILLLVPVWPLVPQRTFLTWLAFPALCYIGAVVLYSSRTNLRYLAPALVPMTIVACQVFANLCRQLPFKRAVQMLTVLFVMLGMSASAATVYLVTSRTSLLEYLGGVVSREGYLKMGGMVPYFYTDMVEYVNEHVPKDGRILMILEARGYYFKAPVIQDNNLWNWPLLAAKAPFEDCMASTGFSHVLLGARSLRYYKGRGLDMEVFRWGAFKKFAVKCLMPVYRSPSFILFEIRNNGKE